jgi:hypothetical protein
MKTIEQAANEYAESFRFKTDNGGWFAAKVSDFSTGAAFAEQWIKVEDELPEVKEDAYEVLVQNSDKRCKVIRVFDEGEVVFISSHFTHWRPINRV